MPTNTPPNYSGLPTKGLQLQYGIQPMVPMPVDFYSGPYLGTQSTLSASITEALLAANNAILPALRFQSMEVRLIVRGNDGNYIPKNIGTMEVLPLLT